MSDGELLGRDGSRCPQALRAAGIVAIMFPPLDWSTLP